VTLASVGEEGWDFKGQVVCIAGAGGSGEGEHGAGSAASGRFTLRAARLTALV